jgi:hypothetical protein
MAKLKELEKKGHACRLSDSLFTWMFSIKYIKVFIGVESWASKIIVHWIPGIYIVNFVVITTMVIWSRTEI